MSLSSLDDNDLYTLYRDERDGRGRDAFNVLMERHRPALVRRLAKRLGDEGAAEDIVQNVFIQLMGAADKFDPARSTVVGWINWLANMRCKNEKRNRYRRPLLSTDWGESSVEVEDGEHGRLEPTLGFNSHCVSLETLPEDKACQDETIQAFWNFVGQLDESRRQTLILVYVKNLQYKEAAAILGLDDKTISRRLQSLLPQLREAMGETPEEFNFSLERRSADRSATAAICA